MNTNHNTINLNINNNDNNNKFKDTNYYTNYLKQNKENKIYEDHKVNYLKYGKV